ncbi:MAG: Ribosomal RNA small subunit methyltransferase E [Pseudomonadales bacterium]|nr:Ribosomal RNA small subunit methyltransferase E [Pseudomonadales bacterium]
MRIPRLFVEQPLVAGTTVELHDNAAHYVRNVLRLDQGARLRVFDGSGAEFTATLESLGRRTLQLVLGATAESAADSPLAVHLGIGLARGERMDWTVQKCTELGVATITPLLLARCNAKFDGGRGDNRLRHWRQVAISACEQSGRNRLPVIGEPVALDRWLAERTELPGLVLHTADSRALAAQPAPAAVRVLVGPEGGLDDGEFARARAAGFTPWSLGPRVLRTETAPVAALAILQYLWGDLAH